MTRILAKRRSQANRKQRFSNSTRTSAVLSPSRASGTLLSETVNFD
jgi:hypothetical protein